MCVCKYFHYVNMCVNILICVLVVNIFNVLIFFVKKKKKKICTMRTFTFDHRHGPAFELTYVCSSVAPYLRHTLLHACVRTYPVRSSVEPPPPPPQTLSTNAIERTYVRSIACVLNPHVTYF
jgi:hypothetical protein